MVLGGLGFRGFGVYGAQGLGLKAITREERATTRPCAEEQEEARHRYGTQPCPSLQANPKSKRKRRLGFRVSGLASG